MAFPSPGEITCGDLVFLDIYISEGHCPLVELLLIQSSPISAVNLLDLPEIFRPFDDTMGWDYCKVFAHDRNQAYTGYDIDEGGPGHLVLCRPDQHIAWIGSMEDTAGLANYFSVIVGMHG
ncbi:Pc21g00430 [Penicillium rubens Wisconsin 54-1255]|jgi:phenol 2-monooxygenase|uniref:Pc21g00430 protein n=1 Tax=Penicillium rubens (strain ATCC 28089 / DSM 1075 / NRRL 1951 / Wisconsin 54-1255) TaxID=500485 RepID=B6HNH5_PENRW|nr:Pc21g00430 [Penicillium rubens Wisconsin 54-1255]